MTYTASEESVQAGQPVELYKFSQSTVPTVGNVSESWSPLDPGQPSYAGPFNANIPSGNNPLDNDNGWVLYSNGFVWAYDPVDFTHQHFEYGGNIGDPGGQMFFRKTYATDPAHTYRLRITMTALSAGVHDAILYGGNIGGIEVSSGAGTFSQTGSGLTRSWDITRTGLTSLSVGLGVGDTTVQLGHEDWDLTWTYSLEDLGNTGGSPTGSTTTAVYYTSADQDIVFDGNTYLHANFTRTNLTSGTVETQGGQIELTIPRDHAVAAWFIAGLPANPVAVTMYRLHRSDLTDPVTPLKGQVVNARFEGPACVLTIGSRAVILERKAPRVLTQQRCVHFLGDRRCQANLALFSTTGTVTAIDGFTITVSGAAAFGGADPAYWVFGAVEKAGLPSTAISAQSGDTLTLLQPMLGLAVNDVVTLVPGCDLTVLTCNNKFNNARHFGGEVTMPLKNPFEGSGILSGSTGG